MKTILRKRLWILLASVVLLLALAACGGGGSSKGGNNEGSSGGGSQAGDAGGSVKIRLSHNMPLDSGPGQSAEKFKQLVEERSGGSMTVEVYGNSQLGSMREQTESVQLGSIEMTIQPYSTLTAFVEDVQLVSLPFLWPNEDVLWKVLDGEAGDMILATMEDAGFKGLGFWASGFNAITANKPMLTPDDFKGVKMRVIPSPLLIAQYEAWGANPVPIDFAELYNALQQGVADAQENPLESIYLNKYYEVQSDLMITNHSYLGYIFTVNKEFFDGLTAEQQQIIIDAEKEARELGRQIAAEKTQEYLEKLKEVGMNVHILTEEQREAFKELSMPVHEQFSKTDRQKQILQKLYEEIEKAQ